MAGQANDGIPTPGLAALDGLKQVGICPVSQLEIYRQGGIQIRQYRSEHGYAVIPLRFQFFENVLVHWLFLVRLAWWSGGRISF
jgi:hypothetical protein